VAPKLASPGNFTPTESQMTDSQLVRVQKFLADSGLCSRRAAEALIAQGEVWINGERATPGQKITPGVDKVTASGKPVRSIHQPLITLAMHKPRGLVCTNDDPFNADTIFTVLPRDFARYRFFCAGRLDKESEGLVILTTDGDLANRLMHPSNTVVKRYLVSLKKPFPAAKKNLLLRGIVIEGERLKVERATLLMPRVDGSATSLDVQMHHGKKREIRQLFTTLGHDVKRLKRYQIGAFALKGIPLRAVKQLSNKEISLLFKTPRPHGGIDEKPAELHED
jgi:23S rRNA pseudouridine2605 synthase